jgi:hypothetical protein
MPFEIKRNDTLAVFRANVTGAGDLTGATVRFHMRVRKSTLVLDAEGAHESYDADTDTNILRYEWAEGDTATIGSYQAEFEVTLDGDVLTQPTNGFYDIVIFEDLA